MKEGDKQFDIPLFKEVYNEEYGCWYVPPDDELTA